MALPSKVPHLMTLADLSAPQITTLIQHARFLKRRSEPWLQPLRGGRSEDKKTTTGTGKGMKKTMPTPTLFSKTIALLFSKRSTRTRISAETSAHLLGGSALFLGREDIQFGANESARDSARVIGGMCQGIFARVGAHAEIEVGCVVCWRIIVVFFIYYYYRSLRSTLLFRCSTRSLIYGTPRRS